LRTADSHHWMKFMLNVFSISFSSPEEHLQN